MARSVTISTPVPTLEEFGKSLGLSKRRQDSLLRLSVTSSPAKRTRPTTAIDEHKVGKFAGTDAQDAGETKKSAHAKS